MSSGWRRWTDEDIHQLHKMTAEGITDEVIALHLCRTVEAVKIKKKRLAVIKPERFKPKNDGKGWTEDDLHTVSRMFYEGKTDEEIGEALGRTWAAVRVKRHDLGLVVKSMKAKADNVYNINESCDDVLQVGRKYSITTFGIKHLPEPRNMIFCGVQINEDGKELYVFESEYGYIETFTYQQFVSSMIRPVEGEKTCETAISQGERAFAAEMGL